ncbi:MAG: oligoendopeptidase F, partial [Brevundimonas sp.]
MNARFQAPSPADPGAAPLWDLTDLYAGPTDPRITRDLTRARDIVDRLGALQGQLVVADLAPTGRSARLDDAVSLYQQASDLLGG